MTTFVIVHNYENPLVVSNITTPQHKPAGDGQPVDGKSNLQQVEDFVHTSESNSQFDLTREMWKWDDHNV